MIKLGTSQYNNLVLDVEKNLIFLEIEKLAKWGAGLWGDRWREEG